MSTPSEQTLKVIDAFAAKHEDRARRMALQADWPDLYRALVGLADRRPQIESMVYADNSAVPVAAISDDDLRALLPAYMGGGAHVAERQPWPKGDLLNGVEWLVQISTGAVFTYMTEGDARRAFRTEHGRRFMVRHWDPEAGGLVVRDLTSEL